MQSTVYYSVNIVIYIQGRIRDFKLGGAHLKKIGVFRVKNNDFTPKNKIPILGGGGAPGAPPGSAPDIGQMSLYFRGPRLEPAKPIGKSGTDKAL
jgi:hypothetical protein